MESSTEKLIDFFAREFLEGSREDLTAETELLELGILDSLSLLKTAEYIEEEFGIEINENDMIPENFQDMNCICQMISNKKTT